MLTIDDNEIYLTRGDTGYLYFTLNGYEQQDGDKITLTVKKNITGDALISITTDLGNAICIEPTQTKELDYGKYIYDIQITTAKGEVFTIIEKNYFHITEEVTD